MPNFLALALNALYYVSLSLWLGGGVALGAMTAPELFRQLPRAQAGGIFAPVLRRFARVRLIAIILAIAAAATKHFLWETHSANVWIVIRWAALTFMAVAVLYEIAALQPVHRTSAYCLDCHDDRHAEWAASSHKSVACENCHGPARTH
ncbi:MAG: DUF4149 domain-containing protein, partial [Thermoanaerobaculia bacterium]